MAIIIIIYKALLSELKTRGLWYFYDDNAVLENDNRYVDILFPNTSFGYSKKITKVKNNC